MLASTNGLSFVTRVRCLHDSRRSRTFRSALRDTDARRGAPRGCREESEPPRTEAEATSTKAAIRCESNPLLNWPCWFFQKRFKGFVLRGITCQRVQRRAERLERWVTFQSLPLAVKSLKCARVRSNEHVEYCSESKLK